MIRNFWDYFAYVFKKRPIHYSMRLISLIMSVAAIISVFQGAHSSFDAHSRWGIIALIVSFVIIIYNIVTIYDLLKVVESRIDIRNEIDFRRIKPGTDIQEDAQIVKRSIELGNSVSHEYLIYSRKFNNDLAACRSLLIEMDERKRNKIKRFIKTQFHGLQIFLDYQFAESIHKRKMFHNESKLCVSQDIKLESGSVYCHKLGYFDSFLTNQTFGKQLINSKNGATIADFVSNFPINKESMLLGISESPVNNEIGISTIGLTTDKQLVFWIQNARAQSSVNQIVPTGSGSCDYADIDKEGNFIQTIRNAMERELLEESFNTGLAERERYIKDTKLIGYYRWINKSGKSEFVGITHLKVPAHTLSPNDTEVREKTKYEKGTLKMAYDDVADLIMKLKEKIAKEKNLSLPLYFNILALINQLENTEASTKLGFEEKG